MDRVRLGRVLGRGARMAARTVVEAVDAATASGSPNNTPVPARLPAKPLPPSRTVRASGPTHIEGALRAAGKVQHSVRAAKKGVLAPVKRASKAVSLQITGCFFTLFALSFAGGVFRFRDASVPWTAQPRVWICAALAALFAYFAASNFLRARKL